MRVGLVGCVKSKQARPAPARDLYVSPLFIGRRRWVEATCDRWFVLSALHGLVDPDQVLEPYDLAMGDLRASAQQRWGDRVLASLGERLGSLEGLVFECHAGADYLDNGLVEGLRASGAEVEVPVAGLSFGKQLAAYNQGPPGGATRPDRSIAAVARGSGAGNQVHREVDRADALDRFHGLMEELGGRLGGARRLADVTGRSGWPASGVYFFGEPGEVRSNGGTRVVRVGTHALTATSKTTLWKRLRQHRGSVDGRGNHRGSIFRLHVGTALLAQGHHPEAAPTWGNRSSGSASTRQVEADLERLVSAHISAMPFLWLDVRDRHERAAIEQGAIGLLSNHNRRPIDPASEQWLGRWAARSEIRSSHLWNVNHVADPWGEGWLPLFESRVKAPEQ